MIPSTIVSRSAFRVSASKTSTRGAAKLTAYSVASTTPTQTPTLLHSPGVAHARKLLPSRPGLLARKVGMITWFNDTDANSSSIISGKPGDMFPCTVLEIDNCQVTHTKTFNNGDTYSAVQLAMSDAQPKSYDAEKTSPEDYIKYVRRKFTRQQLGHFARAGVAPKKHVAEFLVKDDAAATALPLGSLLEADHFEPGQFVDLQSVSKGKGFAGVMKRWGFSGLPASHGVSVSHRSAGSTGMNQDPGRVLPGKKLAGRMGGENVTVQNSVVIDVSKEKGYVLVKGPVPGANGTIVKISDAKKKLPEYLQN